MFLTLVLDPRTKWIGDAYNGVVPASTSVTKFDNDSVKDDVHVLYIFSGVTCGGLRTILEARYLVKCYTSIEIDDISRGGLLCTVHSCCN